MKFYLLFLTTTIALTACYRMPNGLVQTPDLDSIHSTTSSTPPEQKQPRVATCDLQKSMIQNDGVQAILETRVVNIQRVFQRTIRLDCNGRVKSDATETVTSPTVDIDFTNPSGRAFKGVFFFNATTCANKVETMPLSDWIIIGQFFPLTGDGRGNVRVKADLSEATFTEHFNTGINRVYLRFYHDCRPLYAERESSLSGGDECPKSTDFTTVEYPLDIHYTESTLPDTRTVKDSCP